MSILSIKNDLNILIYKRINTFNKVLMFNNFKIKNKSEG